MKEVLEGVVNKSIDVDLINLNELMEFMLNNIGNTDGYLRDNLIYRGFCELILNGKFTDEQLIVLVKTCLDNEHLYLNITQSEPSDDVFTRSFSSLVITLILGLDREKEYCQRNSLLRPLTKVSNIFFLRKITGGSTIRKAGHMRSHMEVTY